MKRKAKTDKAIAKMKESQPTCLLCWRKSVGAHILPKIE